MGGDLYIIKIDACIVNTLKKVSITRKYILTNGNIAHSDGSDEKWINFDDVQYI